MVETTSASQSGAKFCKGAEFVTTGPGAYLVPDQKIIPERTEEPRTSGSLSVRIRRFAGR